MIPLVDQTCCRWRISPAPDSATVGCKNAAQYWAGTMLLRMLGPLPVMGLPRGMRHNSRANRRVTPDGTQVVLNLINQAQPNLGVLWSLGILCYKLPV